MIDALTCKIFRLRTVELYELRLTSRNIESTATGTNLLTALCIVYFSSSRVSGLLFSFSLVSD